MIGGSIAGRKSPVVVVVLILLACARAQAQPLPSPPAPLALLDVPFVSQSEALCGGAAAAMVLRYWGERGITAETFAPLVDRSAAGIRTTALVGDLRTRGWMVTVIDAAIQTVDMQVANGRPVIALIEDRPGVYHYIVIVGVTERVLVFHDPARAPFRAMARDEFDRRSRAGGRWMAVVLPATIGSTSATPPAPVPAAASACDQRVSEGVAHAQAGNLEAAERTLTSALSCPGASPLRELAGVRLLQRRFEEAASLAEQAVALDPTDEYTWKLLGTSRFVLGQPRPALRAWNKAGEPRLDLVRVDGLERTRQRPVERLLGIEPGRVVTAGAFARAERALADLPAAKSSSLELAPVGQGLAELHATIAERPLMPTDVWSWATIGARAAVSRTVGVTVGSVTEGGESLSLEWRYWPGRPALLASLRAPAPWPGIWGADVTVENQSFDSGRPELRRRGGRLVVSRWLTSAVRVEARSGADRWTRLDTQGAFGATANIVSSANRVIGRIGADGWVGRSSFGSWRASITMSSAPSGASGSLASGWVVTASGGVAGVSRRAPLDLWPASDTGQVRPVLARAHPLLEDGHIRVERIGRTVLHASSEFQYWWQAPLLSRIGATVFLDTVRTAGRPLGSSLGDVDVGGGLALASALVPGHVRLDYAHGLRDGADALSIRYVTVAW